MPFAVPVPLLDSVTVKPIWSPALNGPTSATLSTSMWAHLTSIEALSESLPLPPVVVTPAVLFTLPQESPVVWLVMCTCTAAPGAREPTLQVSTAGAAEIVQLG